MLHVDVIICLKFPILNGIVILGPSMGLADWGQNKSLDLRYSMKKRRSVFRLIKNGGNLDHKIAR